MQPAAQSRYLGAAVPAPGPDDRSWVILCSHDADLQLRRTQIVAGFLEHGLIADVRSKPNTTMRRMKVMAQSARPTAASTHTGIGTSSRQPSQMSGRTGSFLIRARQPGTSWIVSRKKQWPDCNEQSHKHHQHSHINTTTG